jgi:hypothetical protein
MAVRVWAWRAGRPSHRRKIPGTHFCSRLSRTQGHSAAGRFRAIEKSNDLIGARSRDLPACSTVPQPTTLSSAPSDKCGSDTWIKFLSAKKTYYAIIIMHCAIKITKTPPQKKTSETGEIQKKINKSNYKWTFSNILFERVQKWCLFSRHIP